MEIQQDERVKCRMGQIKDSNVLLNDRKKHDNEEQDETDREG